MNRGARRGLRKLPLASLSQRAKGGIFEKTGARQDPTKLVGRLAHVEAAGQTDQAGAQVERRVGAVEAAETTHEQRRDDEGGIRVAERIPHQQPRPIRKRRPREFEIVPEPGQQVGHRG
jgi:hypothetical protein